MQDRVKIYCRTHKWMKLHKQVQPYLLLAGFLYISFLEHSNLNGNLIYVLIERRRHKTHTFHQHYKILQFCLNFILIDKQSHLLWCIIGLCYESMNLGWHSLLLNCSGGSIYLKYIDKIFTTSPNDANNKVLQRYSLNYDLNVLIIC